MGGAVRDVLLNVKPKILILLQMLVQTKLKICLKIENYRAAVSNSTCLHWK